MQSLKSWHSSIFCDRFKPFQLLTKEGNLANINFSDFGNYNVVATIERKDNIYVVVQKKEAGE